MTTREEFQQAIEEEDRIRKSMHPIELQIDQELQAETMETFKGFFPKSKITDWVKAQKKIPADVLVEMLGRYHEKARTAGDKWMADRKTAKERVHTLAKDLRPIPGRERFKWKSRYESEYHT